MLSTMVSVESASALITAVSLSATAAALILNAVNNHDSVDLSIQTIIFTSLAIAAAFLFSSTYLYYAEFGEHMSPYIQINVRRIFVLVVMLAFGGIYVPVTISLFRSE